VAAHRDADDVGLARRRQRAAVLAGDVAEGQRQRVGVLDAGAYVVVIAAIARRRPGIALLQQVAADGRRRHRQRRPGTGIAVRIHDEHAVPVFRHLDLVASVVQHAPPAVRIRRAAQGGEGEVGFVHGVGARILRPCRFRLYRYLLYRRWRHRRDRVVVAAAGAEGQRGEQGEDAGDDSAGLLVHSVSMIVVVRHMFRTAKL
jgi:hypothetical protein